MSKKISKEEFVSWWRNEVDGAMEIVTSISEQSFETSYPKFKKFYPLLLQCCTDFLGHISGDLPTVPQEDGLENLADEFALRIISEAAAHYYTDTSMPEIKEANWIAGRERVLKAYERERKDVGDWAKKALQEAATKHGKGGAGLAG